MDDVWRWLLFAAFIILGFLFSAAEASLLSLNESKLAQLAQGAKIKENVAKSLTDKPLKKKIVWMDLSNLICLCSGCIVGTALIPAWFMNTGVYKKLLQSAGNTLWSSVLEVCTVIIAVLILLIAVVTIGSFLPKKLFSQNPEKFILSLYPVVHVISVILSPIVFVIVHLAKLIARLCGVENNSLSEAITEAEIRSMVDEGEESGIIQQDECEMINNIFDFNDCTASDLMTHRTDVVGVEIESKISDIVYYAINEGFSRIPVYEKDIDNIKGVIYVKDLLCLVGCKSSEDFKISDFLRETIYIPEAKRCVDLFRIFKAKKVHLAVVVDDYGGTAGIITLEDLLESIVGNIQDEYDDEQEQIVEISQGVYLFDGAVSLDDVGELFAANFESDEDTDTLGGLIAETLGRVPDDGQNPTVVISGIRFTVMVVEDRRIVKVRAEKENI